MKWNAAYSELTWQKQPCSVLFSCWGEQGTHFQLFRIGEPWVSESKVGGGLQGAPFSVAQGSSGGLILLWPPVCVSL